MGEELYDLPTGWVWVNLGEVTEQLNSGFPCGQHNQEKRGIPHLRPMNINDRGEIDLTVIKYVEEKNYIPLRKGDVLFNNTNSPVHLGKTSYIKQDTNWAYSNHMTRISIFKKFLNPAWIAYGLHNLFLTGYFQLNCTNHVNQASINSSFLLERVKIPLPPLPEQDRIVAKIEELFTELDAGVELLKKLKAKLKRYRQAVLKAAVEGNLTKEWREANQGELEPASVLLERILKQRRGKWEAEQLAKMKAQGKTPKDDSWKLKYKEPVAPDTSDLPELPDQWLWVTLELVANAVDPQPSHRTPPSVDDGIPYIGMGDIKNGKIDFKNSRQVSFKVLQEHQERYQLKLGDFIFGKIGTLGKPIKVCQPFNYTLSANVILIQPDVTFLNPDFAITYMATTLIENLLKKESRATTQAAFGIQKIRIIPFPLAPLQEQLAIAKELELIFSVTEQLEKNIDNNLKRAEKLRQSILKQAFAGKLVPQDPNDEAAEKLLERIKAEKEKCEAEKKQKRQPETKSTQPRKSKTIATQLELNFDE